MHANWKILDREETLEEIRNHSHLRPQLIFKHSTRCGISHHALSKLLDQWDLNPDDLDFYYLDLLSYRPVSNAVSKKFNVMHQSPQLIIIKDGAVIQAYSHSAIDFNKVQLVLG